MRYINQAGNELIKEFEGYKDTAYLCSAEVPTIGWGHTRGVALGLTCLLEQAETWLIEDMETAIKGVLKFVTVPLNDNQYAALVSFTFNLGVGNLKRSTLLNHLNNGFYEQVPAQLMRWNKCNGEELDGLTRRRKAEVALWST